ncbi:RNA 2',3'-cyclic phosphodiesterase [Glycomyces terrestris]|uniref:RNA 2',3'-cyclic phosphodiesterase n=1 Tax=Glycomyces terrestris TaxID=2493553 RepID=A0A426US64_9ACTN|nr:RNA 2',3'-cyclic phosphodiesterase [Glycomyces terrestris]RRR96090.1 RNA 2',3'-cyclic phosphodiesterase [Glycomyces terrestris]
MSASATATAPVAPQVRTERLFAALPLPDNAVADLAEVVSDLNIARRGAPSRPGAAGRSGRLVRSENWHLTLAFLGEVPESRCAETAEVIAAAAREAAPMRLCVSGGGRFGRGRYSVVYAGLDGDVAALVDLVHSIRAGLLAGNLPVDQKQYRPHVTLARPGDRVTNQQAAQDLLTLRRYYGPSWTAGELVLYRSDFGKGPVGAQPKYTPVASAPLGG